MEEYRKFGKSTLINHVAMEEEMSNMLKQVVDSLSDLVHKAQLLIDQHDKKQKEDQQTRVDAYLKSIKP